MKDKNILIISAHADDAVLGMGGTISKLSKDNEVCSLILCKPDYSAREKIESSLGYLQENDASEILNYGYDFFDLKDNRLDTYNLLDITQRIEEYSKESFKPDIVFTHYENDLNIDHRITFQAVMTAFRPIKTHIDIVSFEVLSSTEWTTTELFKPNFFVELSEDELELKKKAFSKYKTEIRNYPHPRSTVGIELLARYRGMTINKEFAEAFKLIRGFCGD